MSDIYHLKCPYCNTSFSRLVGIERTAYCIMCGKSFCIDEIPVSSGSEEDNDDWDEENEQEEYDAPPKKKKPFIIRFFRNVGITILVLFLSLVFLIVLYLFVPDVMRNIYYTLRNAYYGM